MVKVNSVRGVGCVKGWPYFATRLYTICETRSGKLVWKLVGSGSWHRTRNMDTCGRFDGAADLDGARHNATVTAKQAAAITGVEEAVALDKIRDMM